MIFYKKNKHKEDDPETLIIFLGRSQFTDLVCSACISCSPPGSPSFRSRSKTAIESGLKRRTQKVFRPEVEKESEVDDADVK